MPWVDQKSHLGLTLTNQGEFLDKDMQIKKARYVNIKKHLKMVLVKRFLEMVAKIRLTKKLILKVLLAPAERDIKQQQGKI